MPVGIGRLLLSAETVAVKRDRFSRPRAGLVGDDLHRGAIEPDLLRDEVAVHERLVAGRGDVEHAAAVQIVDGHRLADPLRGLQLDVDERRVGARNLELRLQLARRRFSDGQSRSVNVFVDVPGA